MKTAGFAVIERKNRYLLVLEKIPSEYGLWGLPGGKADGKETAEQAAMREVKEETSLTVDIKRELLSLALNDTLRHVYLAQRRDGVARATIDVLCLNWFNFDQIQCLHRAGRLRGDWVMAAIAAAQQTHTRLPA